MGDTARPPASPEHLLGLAFAVSGATLWGLSGAAAQVLFQRHGVSPSWLVTLQPPQYLGGGLILAAVVLLALRPRPAPDAPAS